MPPVVPQWQWNKTPACTKRNHEECFWVKLARLTLAAIYAAGAVVVVYAFGTTVYALVTGPGDGAVRRSEMPDARPSTQWTEIAAPLDANRSILTACDPVNDGFRIYVAAGRSSGSTTSDQGVSVVADASCKK